MTVTGRIFDIKRYAIHDGPGIRTTVFLKGCSLSCPWCHNPESQDGSPELLFSEDRCIHCGACLKVCPEQAIEESGDRIITDRERCTACGQCVTVCPAHAREIVGHTTTVKEVLNQVEKDILFYDESGGGVTLSGGEPLNQPDFCREILHQCKKHDIHTALDTSGYAEEKIFLSVAEHVDLFLYDLKLMDEERHKAYTGVSNELILANLERLDQLEKRIWVRFPLVPGITDDVQNISRLGQFISTLSSVEAVQVLPYHGAGIQKYERLGRKYPLRDLESSSVKDAEEVAAILRHELRQVVRVGG